MGISSYVYRGIKNLIIYDKVTNEAKCNIEHAVDVTLNDAMAEDHLRGGFGLPKILTVYGERDCSLTLTTATMSPELQSTISGNSFVVKTKSIEKIEDIDISGGKFTLSETITSGRTPTIHKIDVGTGKVITPALKLGSPTTNSEDYSIVGKDITCHSSVIRIRVFYSTDKVVESSEAKTSIPRTYRAAGLAIIEEIATGILYMAELELANISIQPTNSIIIKNSSSAPDVITLNISVLMDNAKGYPYALNLIEEA